MTLISVNRVVSVYFTTGCGNYIGYVKGMLAEASKAHYYHYVNFISDVVVTIVTVVAMKVYLIYY